MLRGEKDAEMILKDKESNNNNNNNDKDSLYFPVKVKRVSFNESITTTHLYSPPISPLHNSNINININNNSNSSSNHSSELFKDTISISRGFDIQVDYFYNCKKVE